MTVILFPKMIGPIDIKATVGWAERFDPHPGLLQPVDPRGARTEPRPARTTQGQDRGVCRGLRFPRWSFKYQRTIPPVFPLMTRMKDGAIVLQPFEPGTQ